MTPLLPYHGGVIEIDAGTVVRSGCSTILAAPQNRLQATPLIRDGRLVLAAAAGPRQPTGTDHLVLRVECRTQRDDWNFPYLDMLIAASAEAYLTGQQARFDSLRTEAILRAYNSPDLVPIDRGRRTRRPSTGRPVRTPSPGSRRDRQEPPRCQPR